MRVHAQLVRKQVSCHDVCFALTGQPFMSPARSHAFWPKKYRTYSCVGFLSEGMTEDEEEDRGGRRAATSC